MDGKLSSKEREIQLMQVLDVLSSENISVPKLTDELSEILLEITLSQKILDVLRSINWEEFVRLSSKREKSGRTKRMYEQFIEFLKMELDLLEENDPRQKSLIEVEENLEKDVPKFLEKTLFLEKKHFNIKSDVVEKCRKFGVDVISNYDEPSQNRSVHDFMLYFNHRLNYFTQLLTNRVNLENIMRISQLKEFFGTNSDVTIIGLISDISQTKNGHYMITLEDKTGSVKCFVNKGKKPLVMQTENLCLDEGIAVVGKIGNDIVWIDDFVTPSPPSSLETKKTFGEHYIGFLSDIHFGANVFVEEAFSRFIDFINGKVTKNDLHKVAEKIDYILIAGDIVEGMGIYPDQGKDAKYISSNLQYHEAARWLSQIPSRICLIIIPGNHDSCRLSEPQPQIPYEKAYALYNMPNVIMLSNPCNVSLYGEDESGGLSCYMYHGGSFFYYAGMIRHLREKGGAKVPEEVVKFLLEKRHIAPSHGSTLYIPDSQRDPLVIKKMPDVFVTGHTHKLSITNYKGCSIFSCGCWVEMSDYQEKMGMFPDIGKFPILNTRTRKASILNFYTEKYKENKE